MADNKPKGDNLRRFGLTFFAVDNATSIFLLAFMLLIFGLQSYTNMPKESFPEIPWPKVYINTLYYGNSAADIENLVTRPLEKELQQVSEIETITSSSLQDYSVITAEFQAGIDQDDAVRKVKDAVDKAKPELPTDLTEEPEVLDINFSEFPIMTINLSGEYPEDQLRSYAEYLEDELEDIRMVSKVDIKGVQEREVRIDVDLPMMKALELTFDDIERAIALENVTMSGGELLNNDFRRSIRVVGEFKNMKQIENVIVKNENQRLVYLRDIATVTYGYKDRTSIARARSKPVVSLDVIKKSGTNLLDASDLIKERVEKAKEVFPEGLQITVFNDQSVQTRDQVSNLENSIISSIILVVLVLLFFLGLRNASFVGLAIPLSMLMGILIMSVFGFTMNMVVLFALIMALGMLVDNAIVVVENIYRYMQNGYSGKEAAKYGASEVAMPIIASTATTLAAFAPLAFWPGLMGEFMRYMPMTLIFVLTSSLFVALVINPVFTARFMRVDERADDAAVRRRKQRNLWVAVGVILAISLLAHFAQINWLRNLLWIVAGLSVLNFYVLRPASFYFQNRVLPLLENSYDRFIRFSLKGVMPYIIFGGTLVLLIFSLVLLAIRAPKVEYFPATDPLYVNAFVEMPLGTDIEATDAVMSELEAKVIKALESYEPIVEDVLTQVGENTSDPNGEMEFGASPQKGRLTVSFVPSVERGELSSADAMEDIRKAVQGIPGVKIVVDKNAEGPPVGKPINIEISGENIDELAITADDVIAFLESKAIPGVDEYSASVKIGKPELLVDIDREAAQRFGLSTFAIADAIRSAIFGREVSQFKEGEDEHPIQLRLDEKYRYNITDILNQYITFRSQSTGKITQVPISAVADISYSSTYSSINRKDQDRMITVSSNVLGNYNANEVVEEVKIVMADYEMPSGLTYDFTGEQEEQAEEMEFLSNAFIIALFAIFIIIVAQFNSLVSPVIILLSVLFSTIGVFLGYIVNDMTIGVIMTGMGIISLAGIVVNNAIVLIDYTNLLVKNRREELGVESMMDMSLDDVRQAIVRAGATRLRPVLLTAITTVLGLVPLAVGFNINYFTLISDWDPQYFVGGDNAAFWGTMAWTIIYGLVFATFLTLVVVPVMYWLAFRFNSFVKRLFSGRSGKAETV